MSVRSNYRMMPALLCLILGLFQSGFSYANSALLEAAESGDLEAVRTQLTNGANVNYTPPNKKPKYGYLVNTALEKAAFKGHTEVVALLLAKGAKTRADEWYGLYAATWAGQAGHRETLALLLANANPEPERLDYLFGGALINATRNGRSDAVTLLLEQGVSPNWHTLGSAFPRPAILEAQRSGREEIFSMLLETGGDPTPRHPYPDRNAW